MKTSHAVLLASAVLAASCAKQTIPSVPIAPSLSARAVAYEPVRFVVALPLRHEAELEGLLARISDPDSPSFRHYLSHEQFMDRYAPTAADRSAIARELQGRGFQVEITDQAVEASGLRQNVERYFSVTLQTRSIDNQPVIAPNRNLTLSALLEAKGATIIGADGIPPMHTFSTFRAPDARMHPNSYSGPYGPYFAADLRQAYLYPSYQQANGAGVTIGIVIDSPVLSTDITDYFKNERLPVPHVTVKTVGGGGSRSGIGESTLDVEQSLGTAPGAKAIVFDVHSLSDADVYAGYVAAVKAKVAVVNSSIGQCELDFNSTAGIKELKAFDKLFLQGLTAGTTFVASSGDQAALSCGANQNAVGINWPAASYYVLGVGGTNLTTTYSKGNLDSAYIREDEFAEPNGGGSYWGSGGGYSRLYPRPPYQNGFQSNKGRGLPDVSVHMGGEGFSSAGGLCQAQRCNVDDSSDWVRLQGKWTQEIGTSAASPDFVGLLAIAAQVYGKSLGFVNTSLYKSAKRSGYFRHGIKGNNGYHTTSGLWDPVLGLGTPIGYHIAGTSSPSGTPGSPSNP